MGAGLWHPSGLRESGGDPRLVILSLWSTLKAECAPPPPPNPGLRASHQECVAPPPHRPRPERGFPTPWGSGSQKQLRKQAGNKL